MTAGTVCSSTRKNNPVLKELIKEAGIEDQDVIILTREIEKRGRSFNRVNGHTVPLRFLQDLGRIMIDIHGQSDHISLNDPSQQLLLLDRYANANDLRHKVVSKVEELYEVERELKSMMEDEREVTRNIDLLSFQLDRGNRGFGPTVA